MNSLGCLGGPGFFGSGRVWVGSAMVWAGFGLGLRICGRADPLRGLVRLELGEGCAKPGRTRSKAGKRRGE